MDNLKSLIIIFKTHQALETVIKKTLDKSKLTVNEFSVLEALNTKGDLCAKELNSIILIPNSSMTYVLDTLEKKEYISRCKQDGDKRFQKIRITEGGKEIFERIYQHHFKEMRQVFNVLNEQEEYELQGLLKKVGFSAGEYK